METIDTNKIYYKSFDFDGEKKIVFNVANDTKRIVFGNDIRVVP